VVIVMGRLVQDMAALVTAWGSFFSWGLVILALSVAHALAYRQRRYWQGRLCRWQDRLRRRMDVLRTLIADGHETESSYLDQRDPSFAHHGFVDRCDAALREHFGPSYATRIETRSCNAIMRRRRFGFSAAQVARNCSSAPLDAWPSVSFCTNDARSSKRICRPAIVAQ